MVDDMNVANIDDMHVKMRCKKGRLQIDLQTAFE